MIILLFSSKWSVQFKNCAVEKMNVVIELLGKENSK